MKIIGRILIILVVFAALSGLMVWGVSVLGSGATPAEFERDGKGGEWRPEGGQDEFRQHPEGVQGFPERHERGERGETGGFGWVFGLIKNLGIIAVVTSIIVVVRNISKQKARQATAT